MKTYPEHEKVKEKVKLNNAQEIGFFLDKLLSAGIIKIPTYYKKRGFGIQEIINTYFGIDYQKLMDEKEEMLTLLNYKNNS